MIQEFKISNYLSFRDETVFSFEASKESYMEDKHVVEVAKGVRLLRLVVVYGANASGKTNLLNGLDELRDFWFDKKSDLDEPTGFVPFLLDQEMPDKPTKFELVFWVNGKKYWYLLEVDDKRVYSEKLYYYKTTQPAVLFSRSLEGEQSIIRFNPQFVKVSSVVVEEINLKCLPNMSFFAARNRVNCSLPLIDAARDWMKTGVMPIITPFARMFQYAGSKIHESEDVKKFLLDFMRRADSNITNIKVEEETLPLPESLRNAIAGDTDLSSAEKEKLLGNSYRKMKAMFEHTVHNARGIEQYELPMQMQSDGTQRVLGLEAALYRAMNEEKLLSIDEMESSLHPDLLELVVREFLDRIGRSQLVFTTHYDPLLNTVDNGLLRKDSVLFAEKDESGNTRLYPLTEFRRLNKVSSFQKSYRSGMFGAKPKIER